MAEPPDHDLFVSYAEADHEWVEGYLLDALSSAGIAVHTASGFIPGRPWLDEAEAAVERSKHVLLVISTAYLAGGAHDKVERFVDRLARSLAASNEVWSVIPLVLEPLEPLELPPQLEMLVDINAPELGGRERAVERLIALLNRSVPDAVIPPCPYPGLAPFGESDWEDFHGRASEIQELAVRLHAQHDRSHRLVAVIGPSGSGKTSLVRAGLVPALRASRLFGPVPWTVVCVDLPEEPRALTTVVIEPGESRPGPAVADLLADPPTTPHAIIIDRFERVFSGRWQSAQEGVPPVLEAIAALAGTPGCYVVLVVRIDATARLVDSSLWPLIEPNRIAVRPLSDVGLREAIVLPAKRAGVYVDGELVERLVADASGEPGMLPLVQATLKLLWDRLERRHLPLTAYEALAEGVTDHGGRRTGLQAAMAHHAEAVFAELSSDHQAVAQRMLLRLVQPHGEGSDTRRQRPRDELRTTSDDPAVFDETLDHLASNRLVTLSAERPPDPAESGVQVDLSHTALIQGWTWLRKSIGTHREALRTIDRLEGQVREWTRLGRSGDGLLDAGQLSETERWISGPEATVLGYGQGLLDLMAASRDGLARERQRLRKRLYLAVAFAGVALLAAIVAFMQFREAETQFREARHQATINLIQSIAAQSQLEGNLGADEQSALWAQQAWLLDDNGEVQGQVGTALHATIGSPFYSTRSPEYPSSVRYLAFSADGETLAMVHQDGSLQLSMRAGSVECRVAQGPSPRSLAVAFNRDGTTLASAGSDGMVHLWSVGALACDYERALSGPGGRVFTVAFQEATSGARLAAGSCETDGQTTPEAFRRAPECGTGAAVVRLWSVQQDYPFLEDRAIDGSRVCSLATSPDGQWLAAAGCGGVADDEEWHCAPQTGPVSLWSTAESDEERTCLPGHNGDVVSLTFDPCGHLVSGSADRTVGLWDLENVETPAILAGHDEEVESVAVSRDCALVASASKDGSIGIWTITAADPVLRIIGKNSEWVRTVAFGGADGLRLVSEGSNRTIRTWELGWSGGSAPGIIRGHGDYIRDFDFSPRAGARILASGAEDGTVRVWDLDAPGNGPVVPGFGDTPPPRLVANVAFGRNGSLLAASDDNGQVWVWNLAAPDAPVTTLARERAGGEVPVDFHPVANELATGTAVGMIHLWDADSGQQIGEPLEIQRGVPVTSLAFSPDGSVLVAGNAEGTIAVYRWSGSGLEPSHDRWQAHVGRVRAVVFNADGDRLASGGDDRATVLWDASDGYQMVAGMHGHSGEVRSLVFGPNGDTLLSGSTDQTIRIWNVKRPSDDPVVIVSVNEWIRTLALSPDGQVMAAPDTQGAIRLLVPTTEALVNAVCERVTRNLTMSEWTRVVGPGVPYRITCPNLPPGDGAPGGQTPTPTFVHAREVLSQSMSVGGSAR